MKTKNVSGPVNCKFPKDEDVLEFIFPEVSETKSARLPLEVISELKILIAKLNPIINSTIDSIRLKVDLNALIELVI
ncbi:MAG: hypothetical protein Q7T51_03705 [Candidatus Moranbacteria bacterium]|nr:hypothetical protein [Candidatus Moranbacteria bacterium]